MPFTLAHPAAILPFYRRRDHKLRLAALAIGAMTPDLPFLLGITPNGWFTHTLPGMLLVCVPATAGLVLASESFASPSKESVMRSIALIVVGIVAGVILTFVTSDRVQARVQGQKQDRTRLQAEETTFFAGPNLRVRFVVDTKTKTCYMVGESGDRGLVTAIAQAPPTACQ